MARFKKRHARSHATRFVRMAATVGYAFNYSVASLTGVFELLDENSADGKVKAGGFFATNSKRRLFACGCYVGETARRHFGGFWRGETAFRDDVQVVWADSSRVSPMDVVFNRVARGATRSARDYARQFIADLARAAGPIDRAFASGLAAMRSQRYLEAILFLDSALRMDPARIDIRHQRAVAYRAMGRPRRAIQDLTRCVEAGDNSVAVFLERGRAWKDRKLFDLAIADFTRAVAIDAKSVPAHWERAWVLLHDIGKPDRAAADYSRVLELQPDNTRALRDRALAYFQLSDFPKAVDDYSELVRREPGIAADLLYRAVSYRHTGQAEAGLRDFDEVIRLEPRNELAYLERGALHEEVGQYEKALADFAFTAALSPNWGYGLNHLVHFWATCPDERFRDPQRAVLCGKFVCKLWDHASANNNLAAAYAATGQYEKAIAKQQRAIRRLRSRTCPSDPLTADAKEAEYTRTLRAYTARLRSAHDKSRRRPRPR